MGEQPLKEKLIVAGWIFKKNWVCLIFLETLAGLCVTVSLGGGFERHWATGEERVVQFQPLEGAGGEYPGKNRKHWDDILYL